MVICQKIVSLKKVASSRPTYRSMDTSSGLPIDIQDADVYPAHVVDNAQLAALKK